MNQISSKQLQGPKSFRKGTCPAGKRYSSYFDFHSSIFLSIQTERVPKQSFPPSDFGRLLELMQFLAPLAKGQRAIVMAW